MINFHSATLKNGKLKLIKKDQFNAMNGSLPDGNYILVLMSLNEKDTRSNQNQYFVRLGEWSLHTGYTKEELHEIIKSELFVNLFGEYISTIDLTPDQWTMIFFNLEQFLICKFENR